MNRDEQIEALVKLADDVWYQRIPLDSAKLRVAEILRDTRQAQAQGSEAAHAQAGEGSNG